jgi:nitrate reductase gamma subunit
MDAWIALARGPMFRVALAACLLGLAYHLGNTLWMIRQSHRRSTDKDLSLGAVLAATLAGLLPFRQRRPVQTIAGVAFHAGILLVPIFYVGHVTLWQPSFPLPWPTLGPAVSDALSLAALAGLAALLLWRLLVRTSRELSTTADVAVLLLLLAVTASGYWAAHPASSPAAPRTMLLVHLLAANLALFLTPLTKIVHCVLAPLNPLVSEVAWHFPAESGAHVALALGKENEPV